MIWDLFWNRMKVNVYHNIFNICNFKNHSFKTDEHNIVYCKRNRSFNNEELALLRTRTRDIFPAKKLYKWFGCSFQSRDDDGFRFCGKKIFDTCKTN